MRYCRVFLSVFALLFAAQAAHADIVFTDGEFATENWSTVIISQTGPIPTATGGQVSSGGNPTAFRRVNHTFGGNGSVVSAHLNALATHDPAVAGGITSIDGSFELFLFFGGTSNAVGYGLLLLQDGNYFIGPTVNALFATWSAQAPTDLTASSFQRVGGSGPTNPDFSTAGAPMTFGYFAANGSSLSVPTSSSSGLDNWSVTLRDLIPPTTTTSTTTSTSTTTTSTSTTTSSSTSTTLVASGCGSSPSTFCVNAGAALLSVNEKKPGKEKLIAKLQKADEETTQGDFGDPVLGDTATELCIYDEADTLVAALGIDRAGEDCGAKPCWKATGSKGFQYKDKDATASGLTLLSFRAGAAGKGKALAIAKNNAAKGMTSLPTGITAALAGNPSVTLQLLTSQGLCLEGALDTVKKNQADKFLAKN